MAKPNISEKRSDSGSVRSEYCRHCGVITVAGNEFCCIGCETAFNILHNINLNSANDNDKTVYSPFVTENVNGEYQIIFAVKNIHCASCIKLIENALYDKEDVVSARVNMTTERLYLSWNSRPERVDAFANIITSLGYKLELSEEEPKNDYENSLLKYIAAAGFASGNLMMISIVLWTNNVESLGLATKDFLHFVSAIIALPAIIYSGMPFYKSAFAALINKGTNMDVPISVGVILTAIMSLFETINHGEYIYFDSAVMLIFFLLIGRYFDAKARGKARGAAKLLLSKLSGTARVLIDGKVKIFSVRELMPKMELLIATGENIPVDSVVLEGESEVDVSIITGETLPQPVKKGDRLFAGSLNIAAPINVVVSKSSEDSLLSNIVKLMEKAEQAQAKFVRIADKAASLYTPIIHLLALLSFIFWVYIIGSPWQESLMIATTVLIITCPCALGLAVPVVQILACSKLMKHGVLLKSGDALERIAKIDTVIFDKTGTLTFGRPKLKYDNYNEQSLQIAASIASYSQHPLSKAIYEFYSGSLLKAESVKEIPGKGIEAIIQGHKYRLGSRKWCGDVSSSGNKAESEIWLQDSNKTICFRFNDSIKEDAAYVVTQLKQSNLNIVLLSGDIENVVSAVAKYLDIENYHFELTPIDKCNYIEKLKAQGKNILMVGDGLNDAPALAMANVSMSPSSAIDISQNSSDIVFQGDKLSPVILSRNIALRSQTLIKENFILAVIYNLIAIPIAVAGLVTPLVAAIAMSSSSIIVIANSFRLKRDR